MSGATKPGGGECQPCGAPLEPDARVAVVLGHGARADIARDPSLEGDWMATAGLVLGYAGLVVGAIALFLLSVTSSRP
jgi:Domain of unknown function (DUF4190)